METSDAGIKALIESARKAAPGFHVGVVLISVFIGNQAGMTYPIFSHRNQEMSLFKIYSFELVGFLNFC